MVLSIVEQKITAIIPFFSSSISLIGSALIIYMIVGSKNKFKFSTSRLVFGLSCFDVLQSFATLMSVTFSPKDTTYAWGAIGNQGMHMSTQLQYLSNYFLYCFISIVFFVYSSFVFYLTMS